VATPAPPPVAGAKSAVVQKIKVHSIAIAGNLEGESADRDVFVVLPDSKTVPNGSMYSSSRAAGDFETCIARDLVAYIDKHYRTLPVRDRYGIANRFEVYAGDHTSGVAVDL
jgi:hypothetical protein